MIQHTFGTDGILYVEFTSDVNLQNIKDFLHEFQKIKKLPKELLILYDLRKTKINIHTNDIPEISELAVTVTKKFKTVNTAFVVDKPNLTAYSVLFSKLTSKDTTVRQVFSTMDAAVGWLLGGDDFSNISGVEI